MDILPTTVQEGASATAEAYTVEGHWKIPIVKSARRAEVFISKSYTDKGHFSFKTYFYF